MGIKVNKPADEEPKVAVDESPAEAEAEFSVTYSCYPMQSYKFGPWEFTRGVLVLRSQADADAFERDFATLPQREQAQIRKVDMDAATALALQHQQMATQAFDSAAGRAALEQLQANNPTVGTQPVDTPLEDVGANNPTAG